MVVPKLNYIENHDFFTRILTPDDLAQLKPIPRPEPYIAKEIERPKTPWTFPISLFAQYKLDNEELLNNCFDFDWRCSKIERMIKSVKDKEKIYTYLNSNYRAM